MRYTTTDGPKKPLNAIQEGSLGGKMGIAGEQAPALQKGQTIIRVDPKYFRPTEVETLLGDYSKAREKLGWMPKISSREMCREMVAHDLQQAQRQALLLRHGYRTNMSME